MRANGEYDDNDDIEGDEDANVAVALQRERKRYEQLDLWLRFWRCMAVMLLAFVVILGAGNLYMESTGKDRTERATIGALEEMSKLAVALQAHVPAYKHIQTMVDNDNDNSVLC